MNAPRPPDDRIAGVEQQQPNTLPSSDGNSTIRGIALEGGTMTRMRKTRIVGPLTARSYEGYDTGERWGRGRMVAFTYSQLSGLIEAGDGQNAAGYGLAIHEDTVVDVTEPGKVRPVRTITAKVDGDTVLLYVPTGREWLEEIPMWEEAPTSATPQRIGYTPAGVCRGCGTYIKDPHSPTCPAIVAQALRNDAQANEDALAKVSHHLLAVSQRLAADLIEMHHAGTLNLDTWPTAAEFVASLTGKATQ